MNGRLISRNTAPVPAAKAAADQPPAGPDRRPSAAPPAASPPAPSQQAIGSANIIGYSLNAAPTPSATAASTSGRPGRCRGRCRAPPGDAAATAPRRSSTQHATTVAQTANRSQLWKAYSTSGGASANHQDRSPASQASIAADSSPATASSTAEQNRKSPSVDDGARPARSPSR